VLAAHPSLGVAKLEDLVKLARQMPGLAYATSGIGTQQRMAGEWLARLARIELKHIPYKGGGQAITDLVAGQIPLGLLGSSPMLPHHKSGPLKLLAQSTPTRAPTLQDVPTFQELGYKDLVVDQWLGVFAPAGTPQPIVARLNAEISKALKEADVLERFAKGALEAVGGSPADFARVVQSDFEKYGRIVKLLDIKLE
jgi:tripartite-type tricarboxylate transporter receptor subunit TctC